MRAFYHPDQSMFDPEHDSRFGKVAESKDLPERTANLLVALTNQGIRPEQPAEHGVEPILAVHDKEYVAFLQTVWDRWHALPPERGPEIWPSSFPYWRSRPDDDVCPTCPVTGLIGQLGWYLGDLSLPLSKHCWLSTLRSAETAVSGADAVLAGERMVYSLCRPSGHHARTDRASGFCFINNSAVAAQRLRSQFRKIAILDVDAHHGDGTQQIFYRRDDVLTISVHADPSNYYPYFTGYSDECGSGAGDGFNLNLPLVHGALWTDMEIALDRACTAIRDFGAEVLVFPLGYDSHRDDPIGVLKLEASDFNALGRKVRALNIPTLVVQEGGYAVDAIGKCLEAFLTAFK